MKKIFVTLMMLLAVKTSFATPAIVDYVIDGDTFSAFVKLEDDIKISVRVRIANIDTPEMNGMCEYEVDAAVRARNRLLQLLPVGLKVELLNIKDDKYLGRIDANVELVDGRDVGDIMVKEKLARKYNGGKRKSWCK